MQLIIEKGQTAKLRSALAEAGRRELGGQLFGEQLAPSSFRVAELTVQQRLGTIARFVVDLLQAARDALRFFDSTAHRYGQHNYIGEWHSHPSFATQPSLTDLKTMRELVGDSTFRGNFAVLMIVRLDDPNVLVGDAWVFQPTGDQEGVSLEFER